MSALGGSKVQIAGPTAAFAAIVAGIVARNGMDGLAVATILAGILLVLMGLLRMGSMIKFIPYTITTGFTSGIAVTIVVGQLKDFFGVTFQNAPIETVEKLEEFISCFDTVNLWAVAVGCIALAIQIVWPRFFKRVPASPGGGGGHGGYGASSEAAGEHHRGPVYDFWRFTPRCFACLVL